MTKPLIAFDYAIKYLLRNKGDYDIIEGFLSALFESHGYSKVKIDAILESESNKEAFDMKKSIADLVVEDEKGSKYIVEIERSFTPNFVHKACFNTSRLVVDSISGNQDYTRIKKIFHISLLYFTPKIMEKPIYHGKTIIHEIDTANPVDCRLVDQSLISYENHNVFPEYFFICVPLFDDKINMEIDEWLWVMKYCDTRKDFKSIYMSKVYERLAVLKMDSDERNVYFRYLKDAVSAQDTLNAAKEEGIAMGMEKGMEKGRAAEKIKIAKKLLSQGLDINLIASITGLTIEEIKNINNE